MMDRNASILPLRPEIVLDNERKSLTIEQFQNNVLRPILKFQHDLLVLHFIQQIKNQPNPIPQLDLRVKQTLQNNLTLRTFYIGLIVGLFTTDELMFYHQHTSEINKRIIQMLITRIQSAL